jgi:eukaryotic-like serine/threonine-protein kinase
LEGQAGPAADVYALGLVVLECLTGTRCYPGTLVEAAMARLHRAPVVSVELPVWLRHTLRAMTARDPGRRPPAEAVADAFRCRSVDAVLASTVEADVAALSSGAAPGSSGTVQGRRIPKPSRDADAGRRPLVLAFGGGALTAAAALALLALSLVIWPLGGSGVLATESRTPSLPTSTTVQPGPTASVPTQAVVKPLPIAQPPPPAADVHGADEDAEAASDDNSGHGNGNGRGRSNNNNDEKRQGRS